MYRENRMFVLWNDNFFDVQNMSYQRRIQRKRSTFGRDIF